MKARTALALALLLLVAGVAVAIMLLRSQLHPPAPIQARVLKRSELTPAEIKYGRAPGRDGSITYEDDVVIVEGGADAIRSVSPDWVMWTIDARARHAGDLAVGKIAFVTGRCVGRVLSMKREGDHLNLVLGPVELTEVFRTLEVTFDGPIDLTEAIEVPPPRFEGVTFPLQGDDAVLPEWSVAPILFGPPREAVRRHPLFLITPVALRTVERQNAPVSPGIPQRLDLTFRTDRLSNRDGLGAEMREEGNGIALVAQVQIRLQQPTIEFRLSIRNRQTSGRLILKNAAGLRLAFDGATSPGFSRNINWRKPAPSLWVPTDVGAISFDLKQEIWVQTVFTSKASKFSAGGEYELNADIGLIFDKGRFTTVGPKGLTVKTSLMRNMGSVSLGPSGMVIGHEATMTAGLSVFGTVTVGPQFGLATSVAVAQGASIGSIQCQGAALNMQVRGGVGWSIADWLAKAVNFFLSIFRIKPIPDHGGALTEWVSLFNQPLQAQTDSPACGAAGS